MQKYPFVRQEEMKDCGAACLAMIIEYYHGYYELETLREMTHTTKQGVTAFHILEAARNIGFQADGMKKSTNELAQIRLPAILFVKTQNGYGHYIVLYKVLKNHFLIADPALGIKKIYKKDLNCIYQNVALVFTPIKKINKCPKKHLLPLIKKYVLLYKKDLLFLSIWSFMTCFITIILSFLIPNLLNQSFNFKYILLLLILGFTLKIIFIKFRNSVLYKLQFKLNQKLNVDIFKHILNLPYLYFYNHQTGEVITRMQEAAKFGEWLTLIFSDIFIHGFLGITSLIILLIIQYQLAFLIILFLLFNCLVIFKYGKKNNVLMEQLKNSYAQKENFVYESLTGYSSIKGCHLENNWIDKFKELEKDYQNQVKKVSNIQTKISLSQETIQMFYLLTFITISILIVKQGGTLNNILLSYILGDYSQNAWLNILNSYPEWLQTKWSIKRFLDLTFEKSKKINYLQWKNDYKKLLVKNLSYRYPYQQTNILENISLEIKRGDKILLTGCSGNGKSTFLRLLTKDLPLTSQVIFIDEDDIQTFDFKMYREHIGYISQNDYLFTGTLEWNLTGGQKVSKEKLVKILNLCHIKKPGSLDALILDNGYNLSSGERQRIILGRALLKNFDILLIDEGFSQLNQELERQILQNIMNFYPEMTMIVVTHHLKNKDLFKKTYYLEQKHLERNG